MRRYVVLAALGPMLLACDSRAIAPTASTTLQPRDASEVRAARTIASRPLTRLLLARTRDLEALDLDRVRALAGSSAAAAAVQLMIEAEARRHGAPTNDGERR